MPIKKLSTQLANQIAAGEVVERPSSVVKELIENSIDSEATHIVLEIKKSGRVLIKVSDDGVGICKDELHLALAPHATSKIASINDLNAILTMGFRGEALASISSVSKLVLTSKREEDEHGHAVFVEGLNQDPTIYAKAHAKGTSVEVNELFFNTPARRRFLKSDRTEFLHIKDVFVKEALSHRDISFDFISDGKKIISVKKADSLLDFQKRTAKLIDISLSNATYIKKEDNNLSLEGFLLPPVAIEKSLPDAIYLFLNKRPIADRVIIHALRQAFNKVTKTQGPIRCVFYLTIDPNLVDVNVHPRKDEVRFHESNIVHDFVYNTIVDNLIPFNDLSLEKLDEVLNYKEEKKEDILQNINIKEEIITINKDELVVDTKTHDNDILFKYEDENKLSLESSNDDFKNRTYSLDLDDLNQDNKVTPFDKKDLLSFIDKNEVIEEDSSVNLNSKHNSIEYKYESLLDKDFINNDILAIDSIDDEHQVITLISIPNPNIAFIKIFAKYYLIKIQPLVNLIGAYEYQNAYNFNNVETRELNVPFSFKVNKEILNFLKENYKVFLRMGFLLKLKINSVEIKYIPSFVKGYDLATFINKIISFVKNDNKDLLNGQMPLNLATFIFSNNDIKILNKKELVNRLSTLKNTAFMQDLNNCSYKEIDLLTICLDFLKEV